MLVVGFDVWVVVCVFVVVRMDVGVVLKCNCIVDDACVSVVDA